MSSKQHHSEWLSLVEVTGPFVSIPVLEKVFPQGLDSHDPEQFRTLKLAYDEWETNQTSNRPSTAIHKAWINFVLKQTLGLPDEVLAEGQAIPTLKATISLHGETLRPDLVIRNPADNEKDASKPRLLVQIYPMGQNLNKAINGKHWNASPASRMMELLHATDVRLGLVTNGEQWMLVDAPRGDTTGFASWYAWLWIEQSDKEFSYFRSFRSLLSVRRLFAALVGETLEDMLADSAKNQQEVTDRLGLQVRNAVEILIQSLDRADQDDKVLAGVPETVLYEAALTVMMRLVFLFSAEERKLLLLGDPLYDQHYAVSTLVAQLQEAADLHDESVLERRNDAWVRLLSTFRAVYGGVQHERMKLPAYSGNLFNPDRFPFLEGRKPDTTWRTTKSTPLPVNNRTVLHLLRSLQYLESDGEARRLSFQSLDIEQIGHVYEGLLDHTAKRATEPILGMFGGRGKDPVVPLAELERHKVMGEDDLVEYLVNETGRTDSAVIRALEQPLQTTDANRLRAACGNDERLFERVRPFASLIRSDSCDRPEVIRKGSVYVASGTDRRSSGTHYTPKKLTEPIVQYTLEPLVYIGPAEGKPNEEWKLRPASELLDLKICDMACGSGAFLVQACRYLSELLVKAWQQAEDEHPDQPGITPEGTASTGVVGEQLIPKENDERSIYARRIVAQRCLYGVDKNPLAVEMAKLSLWLLTLAKDKPFEFLDHAIRCGDSLVGIQKIGQLDHFNMDGKPGQTRIITKNIQAQIKNAISLRRQITEMQATTVEDVEAQDRMLREANEKIDWLKCAANLLISAEFVPGSAADKQATRDAAAVKVAVHWGASDLSIFSQEAKKALGDQVTFNWPLEFPEVMIERGGFDAFVGNPPFMGGSKISGSMGDECRSYFVEHVARNQKGNADLCAYFFLRAFELISGSGQIGLIATNTISQGDTREVGLEQMCRDGGIVRRAIQSTKWPGTANLEIAEVWVSRLPWNGEIVLDEKNVPGITPYLTMTGAITGSPKPMFDNQGFGFSGTYILGNGFLLTHEERRSLVSSEPKNAEVLQLYLSGEDFNSTPDQSASRWVINFQDWPLHRQNCDPKYRGPCASDYPSLLALLEERVRPERAKNSVQSLRDNWWIFKRRTPELVMATTRYKRVLFHGFTSKYVCFGFVPTGMVYAGPHIVVALPYSCCFAVLQSSLHISWAFAYCSTHETRLRYAPSDLFETFPFPFGLKSLAANSIPDRLEQVGDEYHEFRKTVMATRSEGLTQIYNRFHNSDENSVDVKKLRQLHVEIDNAVTAAYGWSNLNLDHGFHETKQGVRYTISETARHDVLQRLLKLNHE